MSLGVNEKISYKNKFDTNNRKSYTQTFLKEKKNQ